ncbi:TlpA disulfide reductase family protein [Pinibacter soli]|uniref:TlpA disulfide reductase family protein n=1 Tax=Pinibacter soli TaxID=3044211 RepID=A0ABT6R9E9_9BACT|nr:TlpA disulfide reductase family protein [Pinibacter soli]MDI3319190.1 TlpA disulfide reductase family protein [Pinibacter soli]
MKRIVGILAFLPLSLYAQKGFEMKGNVAGLQDKSLVFLIDANNPKDTVCKTISGKTNFTLKGDLKESTLYYIGFTPQQKKTVLFLDNSKTTATGDINDVKNLKVTGSPAQADFDEFQKTFNPYFDKLTADNQMAQTSGMTDSLQTSISSTVAKVFTKVDEFIATKPNSSVSPFVLLVTSQLNEDMAALETRYSKLTPDAQNSFFGKYLGKQLADSKFGTIGSKAPEFTQNDTQGKPVSLSSFKGKYVLVDFWASWCGPCRMENPNVVTAFNKFKDKNFAILGVSLDKNKDAWLKAIKDDGLSWTQVSDLKYWQNEVATMYKVQSIPQNFLIDPNGNIVARDLRGPALESKLCELLGCN